MSDAALQRVDLLDLPLTPAVSVETVCEFLRKKETLRLVTFVSPDSWALAKRYPEYLESLRHMTFNLAGSPAVAWACRWLTGMPCARFRFGAESLAVPLFRTAVAEGASLVLVGGKPGVDEGARDKLQSHYPALRILNSLHGYGEFEPKISEILALSPDFVLVDMNSPRQDTFLFALSKAGYRGMVITCKGYFRQCLAEDGYYPPWVERWNLHFIWTLYKDPERSRVSYLGDYLFFIKQVTKAFMEKGRARFRRQR